MQPKHYKHATDRITKVKYNAATCLIRPQHVCPKPDRIKQVSLYSLMLNMSWVHVEIINIVKDKSFTIEKREQISCRDTSIQGSSHRLNSLHQSRLRSEFSWYTCKGSISRHWKLQSSNLARQTPAEAFSLSPLSCSSSLPHPHQRCMYSSSLCQWRT